MENYQFTLRLISPLKIIEVPEFITWKEREIVSDITSFCRNDIQLFILEHASEREREIGMMIYYDKSSTVNEKVKAAFISVEVIGDRLMGVLTCHLNELLNEQETDELKQWWCVQLTSGYGKWLGQQRIKVHDIGNVYCRMAASVDDVRTEIEEAPDSEKPLWFSGMSF